ncbi:MAG TPA: response regulator transcription factor [Steroidobacteraceae bacterium]|jgi:DNA-binding NarL/FixJ family response regulator|nr:response regulator transcription factor [Steroidobacteraceae bacterium]
MTQPTLIIADDHPLFRAALREVVGRQIAGAQIIEVSSLDALQAAIANHPDSDMVLLDLRMPGARGLSSLLYLRAEYPTVPIVVVSASEDPCVVQRTLDFGASGFIPKSASIETIGESLRAVLDGGICAPPLPERRSKAEEQDREQARRLSTLTPQQLKVLVMLAEGQSNKYIAAHLAITEATVKAHITGILRKLGIERRTQAAVLAQRLMQTGDRPELRALDDDG